MPAAVLGMCVQSQFYFLVQSAGKISTGELKGFTEGRLCGRGIALCRLVILDWLCFGLILDCRRSHDWQLVVGSGRKSSRVLSTTINSKPGRRNPRPWRAVMEQRGLSIDTDVLLRFGDWCEGIPTCWSRVDGIWDRSSFTAVVYRFYFTPRWLHDLVLGAKTETVLAIRKQSTNALLLPGVLLPLRSNAQSFLKKLGKILACCNAINQPSAFMARAISLVAGNELFQCLIEHRCRRCRV